MESEYNRLLVKSREVGDFFENTYSPILQAIPWIDPRTDSLNKLAQDILPYMAFYSYALSSFNGQTDQASFQKVRSRLQKLEAADVLMKQDLQPILTRTSLNYYSELGSMVQDWLKLANHEELPDRILRSIKSNFVPSTPVPRSVTRAEAIFAKLLAYKIGLDMRAGNDNHQVSICMGDTRHWVDAHFLESIRGHVM